MRIVLAAIGCIPLALFADDRHSQHDHAGHNLGEIGATQLKTSCKPAAQQQIDQGVALVHSFWYVEAEKAFRRAADADSQCGMAWWGVALSNLHPLWAPPTPAELRIGKEAADKATQIGAQTQRERGFIDAIHAFYTDSDKIAHGTRMLAYEKAMANVASANPTDHEAAIFHALALLGTASPSDKTYANQKKAGEILNRILPQQPHHPGIAHYLIHSFDYPELAELALPAARVYAKLAPGSPHALHMPSHIFTRRGLWEESIAANTASADKARRYAAMTRPGTTAFDELHAIDYLVYAYLQQGDIERARALVTRTTGVTKLDTPNHFAAVFAITAVPARFALERREWQEAASLSVPSIVDWNKVPYAEANIHFARGIGAARSEDLSTARAAISRLAQIRDLLLEQKNAYWADQVEIQRLTVAAWSAHGARQPEQALDLMRAAVDLEAASEKHPVTPGAIIPAREYLAEMLLDAGRTDDAIAEIDRVLLESPNRRNALRLAAQARSRHSNASAQR